MVTDLSYVSIAVNNIDTAIRDFQRIYGLQQVTPISYSRPYGWLRVILGNGPEAFLELLQPTDDKLPLARFVQNRGESVYLYSFVVDNLAETFRRLQAGGIRFAHWPEGGKPERVRSIWIHPRSTTGVYIELTEHLLENEFMGFGGGSADSDTLLKELSYVAAVVQDIEAATKLYMDLLGLEITGPRNTEPALNFERVVLGRGKRGLLELMQPNDPASAMARYLERRGQGPYMSCFLVDDVAKAVGTIKERGGRADPDPRYGAWVHPNTSHGLFMQLSTGYLGRGE